MENIGKTVVAFSGFWIIAYQPALACCSAGRSRNFDPASGKPQEVKILFILLDLRRLQI